MPMGDAGRPCLSGDVRGVGVRMKRLPVCALSVYLFRGEVCSGQLGGTLTLGHMAVGGNLARRPPRRGEGAEQPHPQPVWHGSGAGPC